jgi:hypothetical protein
MHVAYKGRIADLADLRDGSVFLADLDGGPTVRAMKAFYASPSGIHGGKIVTVGPFRAEDEGKPGVYEPDVIRQLAVVDLTGVLTFTFSIELEHVTFKLPSSRECPGLVVLVEDDAISAAGSTKVMACGRRRTWTWPPARSSFGSMPPRPASHGGGHCRRRRELCLQGRSMRSGRRG